MEASYFPEQSERLSYLSVDIVIMPDYPGEDQIGNDQDDIDGEGIIGCVKACGGRQPQDQDSFEGKDSTYQAKLAEDPACHRIAFAMVMIWS